MTDAIRRARTDAIISADEIRTGKITYLRGLQACRNRTGLTQRQAAAAIGCPHATYRNWEGGANWPSSIWLPLIAEAFRCSIIELYFGPVQEGGPT